MTRRNEQKTAQPAVVEGRKLVLDGQTVYAAATDQPDEPAEHQRADVELVAKFQEWLDKQRVKADQQEFNNPPDGIVRSFPKAQQPNPTEKDLARKLWWWRQVDTTSDATPVPFLPEIQLSQYRDYFEWSAYHYELRARLDEKYAWGFGHPWCCCSREQRQMLRELWPSPYPPQKWTSMEAGKPEWREVNGVRFNLKLNNSVLIEQFIGELERLRAELGVEAPAAGQGVRRKPISWLPIELMDLRHYEVCVLNDSERSQVSKAARAYREACRKVIAP